MQLSEMLGRAVRDARGRRVGTVVDVRLAITGLNHEEPKVFGLVISPRTGSSYLGYERSAVDKPVVLAALLRWRHRGTFLAVWADVAEIGPHETVGLREGFTRYSPVLP